MTSVRPFGLFVEVDELPGLILIPELSWACVRDPGEVASVGDVVRCMVLAVPEQPAANARFSGSIRRCFPERDPWREPEFYAPGDRFVATVERVRDWGYWFVHPERGADVLLRRGTELAATFEVGDRVELEIRAIDLERRTVLVDLARWR